MTKLAFALVILAACDKPADSGDGLDEARNIAANGPYLDVDLQAMKEDYASNPVAADERYLRKGLRFKSSIYKIGQDAKRRPFIIMGNRLDEPLVTCIGMRDTLVARLNIGQYATVRGVGAGTVEGVPSVAFCEVD